MKTLPTIVLALLLILPAAMAQTPGAGATAAPAGKPSPVPGPSIMWEGKLRQNCHVIAVTEASATISSSSGAFVAVWKNLPEDVRKQLQPEYDAIVKGKAN